MLFILIRPGWLPLADVEGLFNTSNAISLSYISMADDLEFSEISKAFPALVYTKKKSFKQWKSCTDDYPKIESE